MIEQSNHSRNETPKIDLDRIDCGILRALQNDARISNKQLASEVGLSPSSCLERVRKLERCGVLKGFHAEIEPKAVGIALQAMVTVRITQHSRETFVDFREYALALPEVIALYQVAGADDFMLHIAARDTSHLHDLVLDHLVTQDEVSHLETALIFNYRRAPLTPMYVAT